jgi:hypothetical protein
LGESSKGLRLGHQHGSDFRSLYDGKDLHPGRILVPSVALEELIAMVAID